MELPSGEFPSGSAVQALLIALDYLYAHHPNMVDVVAPKRCVHRSMTKLFEGNSDSPVGILGKHTL